MVAMIDFRHETFLALCRIGHYTKTAEYLHITQPAVSQHIKFLEDLYGGRLFERHGRVLSLTERGERLLEYVSVASADSAHELQALLRMDDSVRSVSFGATLSIGEYVMPPILSRCIRQDPDMEFHMQVGNTQTLLAKLHAGEIDFACIEGFFDKARYEWSLFSEEPFIAVCGPTSDLVGKSVRFDDLLGRRVILREQGSGTRDILERLLWERNLSVESFSRYCEVGNMHAIKTLVSDDVGITFLYEAVAKKELDEGSLIRIAMEDFTVLRAFHFVCLKGSRHIGEYRSWFERFVALRS
jgi:DNA-binding transcriptional LysR family regulator